MKSLKRNYFYQTLYQILLMIIPFITSPYISRVLGAEQLGIYSFAYSIVTYFVMFTALGINNYGSRLIAGTNKNEDAMNKLFSSLFATHLLVAFFAVFAYIVYMVFFSGDAILSCILFLFILGSIIDCNWLFSGKEEFKILAMRGSVIKVLSCILILLFVKNEGDIYKYALILSGSSFCSSLSLFIFVPKYVRWEKPSWKEMIVHLKPLFVLALPLVLTTIYMTSDKIILGLLSEKREVAFYENSEKMVIVRNFIYSIGTIMLPRISSLYAQRDYEKIKEYIRKSTEISLILCYALSFGLMACSIEFAPVFWGEEFKKCGVLIILVAVMIMFNTIANTIRSQYLIPLGKDKDYVMVSVIGAVSNVVLDIVFIPFYQSIGAMVATVISSAMVALYLVWIVRKELPMVKYIYCTKYYFLLGILMLIICRLAGGFGSNQVFQIVIEVLVGVIVYVVGCLLYWIVKQNDYYLNLLKKLRF